MASAGRPNSRRSCSLQMRLPLRSSGGIPRRQEPVCFGVPFPVVHSVQDAGQHVRPRTQRAVQAESEFGRLDFARIRGANRAQPVGERDAAFDVADVAEELHAVGTIHTGGQGHIRQRGLGKQPLVAQVVDGEQGADAQIGRVRGRRRAQIGRHQSRLPVVAMEDLGAEQIARHAQGRAREYGEPDVVIRIIQAGLPVEALPVKQRRAIHQVQRELFGRLVDGGIVPGQSQVNGQAVEDPPQTLQIDGTVPRNDHGDVIAKSTEGGG